MAHTRDMSLPGGKQRGCTGGWKRSYQQEEDTPR